MTLCEEDNVPVVKMRYGERAQGGSDVFSEPRQFTVQKGGNEW